jgi:hypothetical protein
VGFIDGDNRDQIDLRPACVDDDYRARSLGVCRKRVPGRVRVHVISPVRDLPVSKFDDRAEPIFILGTRRVDIIIDRNDMAVVRFVDDQLVCGPKPDAADISLELIHQVSASPDHTRPA